MSEMNNLLSSLKEEAILRERIKTAPVADCGDGVYRTLNENASEADFDRICAELRQAYPGAPIYENEIVGNRFFGVSGKDGYVYVSYLPVRKRLSVFYGNGKELLPTRLGDKPSYKGACRLTQFSPTDPLETPHTEGNFGMCYIFELGEGHFLMYDGLGPRQHDDERIIAALKAATPAGQKPIIDAWIFTHAHYDHVAGVEKLALKYGQELEVRNFVMNMADPSRYTLYSVREISDCYMKWLPHIFETFPDAKIWKAHTGQRFAVGDAEIEVLYTQEDFVSGPFTKLNDTSLVTRVYYAGKSFFFPADVETREPSLLLHDAYGKYLKSDFYQVAHHGWEAEALYYYGDVDPECVLFPVRLRHWHKEKFWEFPASAVLKKEIEEGKRTFYNSIAEDIVIEF